MAPKAPGTFGLFDYVPFDWTDEAWLSTSTFWMDDSENYYADVEGGAGYILNASTPYYLCVRSADQITGMDYPFWDLTGLLPVATTGGYFTLDAAVLENSIPVPPSSWPFPGPIYEVTIDTNVGVKHTLGLMGVGG